MLSKTLAEEAAWKFAKENKIDMVAINPGLVIGPLLQPTLNTSVEPALNLVNGILQSAFRTFFYHFFMNNTFCLCVEEQSALKAT